MTAKLEVPAVDAQLDDGALLPRGEVAGAPGVAQELASVFGEPHAESPVIGGHMGQAEAIVVAQGSSGGEPVPFLETSSSGYQPSEPDIALVASAQRLGISHDSFQHFRAILMTGRTREGKDIDNDLGRCIARDGIGRWVNQILHDG